ncbi:MAG: hypothetical protein AB4426_12110 [Xenococcaceae cyanobacterium]
MPTAFFRQEGKLSVYLYYQLALEITVKYGDRYFCTGSYHQLGRVAEDSGKYEEANSPTNLIFTL